MASSLEDQVTAILMKPYRRCLQADEETGRFTATILEFPGCITEGATAAEAAENLESVATSWLMAVLDKGQKVPSPPTVRPRSGRIVLRLSKSLHLRCAEESNIDGVSINQFIVNALSFVLGIKNSGLELDVLQEDQTMAKPRMASTRLSHEEFGALAHEVDRLREDPNWTMIDMSRSQLVRFAIAWWIVNPPKSAADLLMRISDRKLKTL